MRDSLRVESSWREQRGGGFTFWVLRLTMIIFSFPFFPVGWITTYLWDGAVRPSFATKWKAREEVKRDESRYYPSRPARLPFFPPHRWWPFLLIFFFLFLSFTLYLFLFLSFFPSIHLDRSLARFDANICDVSLQRTRFIAIQRIPVYPDFRFLEILES